MKKDSNWFTGGFDIRRVQDLEPGDTFSFIDTDKVYIYDGGLQLQPGKISFGVLPAKELRSGQAWTLNVEALEKIRIYKKLKTESK